jgi:hypothetical protein
LYRSLFPGEGLRVIEPAQIRNAISNQDKEDFSQSPMHFKPGIRRAGENMCQNMRQCAENQDAIFYNSPTGLRKQLSSK